MATGRLEEVRRGTSPQSGSLELVRVCALVLAVAFVPAFSHAQEDPIADGRPSTSAVAQDELVKGAAAATVDVARAAPTDSIGPNGAFSYSIPIKVPPSPRSSQPNLSLVYNSQAPNSLVGAGWTLTGIPAIYRVDNGTGVRYDGTDTYAANLAGFGAPTDPAFRLVDVGNNERPAGYENPLREPIRIAFYLFGDDGAEREYNRNWFSALREFAFAREQSVPPFAAWGSRTRSASGLIPRFINAVGRCLLAPRVCVARQLGVPRSLWRFLELGLGHFAPFVANSLYHTAAESWSEYASYGRCGDGPCYWVVRNGGGVTMYFGGDPNTHANTPGDLIHPVLAERYNGNTGGRGIYAWYLYRVEDLYGNGYEVEYERADNAIYPANIRYNADSGIWVHFVYLYRPDVTPTPDLFSLRLAEIQVNAPRSRIRKYALTYEQNAHGKSRLKSLQEFGVDDSLAYPPYQFNWSDPQDPVAGKLSVQHLKVKAGWNAPVLVGDLNGDGISDLILASRDFHGTLVSCALGSSTGPQFVVPHTTAWNANASYPSDSIYPNIPLVGDVNGDGRSDLVFLRLGKDRVEAQTAFGTTSGLGAFQPTKVSLNFEINDLSHWRVGLADLNNDQIADLVVTHPRSPTVLLSMGTPGGLGPFTKIAGGFRAFPNPRPGLPAPVFDPSVLSRLMIGDVNGDHKPDLIVSDSTAYATDHNWDKQPHIHVALATDTGLDSVTTLSLPQLTRTNVAPILGDINGDGRVDLLFGPTSVLFGDPTGLVVSPGFDTGASLAYATMLEVALPAGLDEQAVAARDLNGDGIDDVMGRFQVVLSLGSPSGHLTDTPLDIWPSVPGDVNGDGIADLMQLEPGSRGVRGFPLDFPATLHFAAGAATPPLTSTIIYTDPTLQEYRDLGGGLHDPTMLEPTVAVQWVSADINGDGHGDIILYEQKGYSNGYIDSHADKGPFDIDLRVLVSEPNPADILHQVTDDLGGQITIAYEAAPRSGEAVFPSQCIVAPGLANCAQLNSHPRPLATSVTRDNGRGFVRTTSYQYTGGRLLHGPPFTDNDLGFSVVTRTDDDTQAQEVLLYRQDVPFQRQLAQRIVRLATGERMRVEQFDYQHGNPYPGVDWVAMQHRNVSYYELDQHVRDESTGWTYDAFGGAITELACAGAECITSNTWFAHDVNNWILRRVDEKNRRERAPLRGRGKSTTERLLEWESFQYDQPGYEPRQKNALFCPDADSCRCPISARTCTPKNSRWVAVEAERTLDSQGNVTSVKDANGHATANTYDQRWGLQTSTTRTATNDQGTVTLVSTTQYDDFGRLSHEIDENLADTGHVYDGLGRRQRIDHPNGAHELYDYFSLGSPNAQLIRHVFGPDGTDPSSSTNATLGQTSLTLFDGFGATYITAQSAGEGRTVLTTRAESIASHRRRVTYTRPAFSEDFGDAAKIDRIIVDYDQADRPKNVSRLRADHSVLLEAYSYGVSTLNLTDVNNRSTQNHYDDRGLLDSKIDASGTWTYRYDVAHQLRSVTMPSSDQLRMTYDSWNRRYAMTDPFAGQNLFVRDDVGNETQVTDARQKTVNYTFDEVNRVKTKRTDSGTITFHYDHSTGDYSMGRLASVDDTVGAVALHYDIAGHLTDQTLQPAAGGPTLVSHREYDFWGRLTQKRFTNNRTLTYEYPDGHALRSVKLDGVLVASLSKYSPYGLPSLKTTSASNSTLSYAPDGVMSDAVSSSISGIELQHLHFDHDPIGNLSGITDQRASTLVNGIETSESQTFKYDGVNRLKNASSTSYGSVDYDFDSAGSLKQKGDLLFVKSGSSWMATRASATVASWDLDSSGDVVAKTEAAGQWGYDYDTERRLSAVRLNGRAVVDFSYDYSGQRVRKGRYAPDGSTATTYYLDGYEIRRSSTSSQMSETIHLWAPHIGVIGSVTTGVLTGQPTAATVASANGPLTGTTEIGPAEGSWWYLTNYVGSPGVIIDSTGTVAARIVYQPFGEVQVGNSTGFAATTLDLAGHSRDDETKLVYFGARYYDALFGRFTSCDDRIPGDSVDPRGFNRQAYALNNPMGFTDPDGHLPILVWLGWTVAGGIIGGGSDAFNQWWQTGKISDWREVKGAFIGGMVVAGMLALSPGSAGATWTGLARFSLAGINGGLAFNAYTGRPTTIDSVSGSLIGAMIGSQASLLFEPYQFRLSMASNEAVGPPPVALATISEAESPITQVKYHYTTADESSFSGGLRAQSSVTDKFYSDPIQASQELGIPVPDKVIPIVDRGQFVPNAPAIIEGTLRYEGGGSDFTNPRPVPASDILPAIPLGTGANE